ncbi:MAG: translation initiation factor IF-2 [Bacteroidia bacterium]|nr:translation initiation factor IF-2 [Bacteroidia bacterium]
MARKKNYRLFQVAKELNVGTALLVDHLQEKGHSVDNSPNTKISGALYEVLLEKFASEKLIKEKAEQEREDKELVQKDGADQFDEKEPSSLTASDLRESINDGPVVAKRRRRRSGSDAPVDIEKLKKVDPEPKVTPEPKVEAQKPEDDKKVGLKVKGYVDLDQFNKKKKPQAKAETPKADPKKPQNKSSQDKPKDNDRKTPEKRPPVQNKVNTPQKESTPKPPREKAPEVPAKKPVADTNNGKETVKKEAPKTQPKEPVVARKVEPPKEEKKPLTTAPQAKNTPDSNNDKGQKEGEGNSEVVIRAENRAPKLSGLKVMGKIELPSDKRKRKSKDDKNKKSDPRSKPPGAKPNAEKPQAKSEGNKQESDENKKKRRRRKRKRKSSETTPQGQNNSNNNNRNNDRGGNKKEKPSEKAVGDSIKSTFSQMNRGASRNRQKTRRRRRDEAAERRELAELQAQEEAKVIEITEFITANEFANLINVPVNEIITKSFSLGMMISINQRLDAELLSFVGEEYGYEVKFIDVTEKEIEIVEEEDDPADLGPRNPIITVMGHVDHGKTTLLDRLRNANVAEGEAGGITQHIGAYQVNVEENKSITFIDTPGHEAFTAMRARGAKVTDVAIIVIAADDAVMPQTREAINHAQAAEVPMVFAFNKIDKAGADPEKIKSQLAEMNLLVEDWGGTIQAQEISALKDINVEDLLEKVIFEAEVLELKANPDRPAVGTVIEARLDRGRGNVATLLVQTGTLRVGDEMVAGIHYGKVRALINQKGQRVKEAGPSMPVQVLGLTGQPTAGDKFYVFKEDGKAKDIAQKRQELFREQQLRKNNRLTLEEIGRRRALGNFKELNVIIRADVDGSVEALSGALMKLSTEEVQVNIIWKAVGAISEADINLAIASDAIVMAFNVRPNAQARSLADREDVDIRTYSVIYDAINDVRDALEGLLSPELREEEMGTAEIKEVFRISNVGNVAGALVTTGKIERNNPVRVVRDGVVIYPKKEGTTAKLGSLKRFKDDVKDVLAGFECGFTVDGFDDLQVGDMLESYKINEIRRKLQS